MTALRFIRAILSIAVVAQPFHAETLARQRRLIERL
jgi:hypothetical protein